MIRAAPDLDEVAGLWITLASHHSEVGAAPSRVAEPVGAAASWVARRVSSATVSVIAGNGAAQRFSDRPGAVPFTRTSVFPV
jgi:hypothetical protein